MAITANVVTALTTTMKTSTRYSTISIAAPMTAIDAAVLAPDAAADATKWQSVFNTLEKSFSLTQASPTVTAVKIDQSSSPIATTNVAGDFTFGFTVPDISAAQMALFFNGATLDTADLAFDVLEVGMTHKVIKKGLRLDLSTGDILILNNTEMIGVITKASEDAFSITVTGTVLAADGKELVVGYKK